MILQILKFLIPHFVSRCLMYGENGEFLGAFQGAEYGPYLIIEPEGAMIANKCPVIIYALGLSWLGCAIFFWVKSSYDRIET